MKKVLVVFGSASDSRVYERITKALKRSSIEFDVRICSAHRTPEEICNVLAGQYSLVIAGAGLSAALPGVIASKSILPVIGVPVKSNYMGLDALLSIAQMPPGIPVLAVGVDNAEIAAEEAAKALKDYEEVTIIADNEAKPVKKAKDIMEKFGVRYRTGLKSDPHTINLEFVYFDEPPQMKGDLCIYCPMLMEDDDSAEAAINFLEHSRHGLWVGLNNGENAALAAIEILNSDGRFTEKLHQHRRDSASKVRKQDKEASIK